MKSYRLKFRKAIKKIQVHVLIESRYYFPIIGNGFNELLFSNTYSLCKG